MFYHTRRTVARVVETGGVGLHGGVPVTVRLVPSAAKTGITFVRTDLDTHPVVAAELDAVVDTRRATTLGSGGVEVRMVEHLLAACYGLGVSDLRVELDGGELPALDGSAAAWVSELDRAGRFELAGRVEVLDVPEPVERERVSLYPLPRTDCDGPSLTIAVRHEPGRGLPAQELALTVEEDLFRTEIGPARTFAFVDEVEGLRAAQLARGGSLDNALLLDPHGEPVNPDGFRLPLEPARHKMLDAIGDLALLGVRVYGRLELRGAGHRHHVGFFRHLATANRRT